MCSKLALILGMTASLWAQFSPSSVTIQSRQTINRGDNADAWQALQPRQARFTFTAAAPWTGNVTGSLTGTLSPSSGPAGTQTVVFYPGRPSAAGTQTATLTAGGHSATVTLTTIAKLPQFNSVGGAGCTNPVSTLYNNPAACLGTWSGSGPWVDNSTGRVITKLADSENIAYASKRAACGDMVFTRQTVAPGNTRIRRISDGALLYDALPGTHETNEWAPDCLSYVYMSGLTLRRYTLAGGANTVIADYANAPGPWTQMQTGGTASINDAGWLAISGQPSGASTYVIVCAVQTIGLTTANQNSQTYCIDIRTLGGPTPTLTDYVTISPVAADGSMILQAAEATGEFYCRFTGIAIVGADCRRMEGLRDMVGNVRIGTVNVSGTAVSWVSGDVFTAGMVGRPILLNNTTNYTVASFTDNQNIVLTSSAGTQTGVSYWADTVNEDGICQTQEFCYAVQHSDLFREPSTGAIWRWFLPEEFRGWAAVANLTKFPYTFRPIEEGGGMWLGWANTRTTDAVGGGQGVQLGCEGHICGYTSYSNNAADATVAQMMQLQILDTRDWTQHQLVSAPFVNSGYTRIPHYAITRDGCTVVFSTALTGSSDADTDVYKVSTGACATQPPVSVARSLRVSANSTKAVIAYTAPSTAVCQVSVGTNPAVLTLIADTSSPANDNRAGSISSGTSRQFVVGTVSALSPSTDYYYKVQCGVLWTQYGAFRTLPAGATSHAISVSSATAAEVSANADMSSPTNLGAATTQFVTVPDGTVRYFRFSGRAIQVLL